MNGLCLPKIRESPAFQGVLPSYPDDREIMFPLLSIVLPEFFPRWQANPLAQAIKVNEALRQPFRGDGKV